MLLNHHSRYPHTQACVAQQKNIISGDAKEKKKPEVPTSKREREKKLALHCICIS